MPFVERIETRAYSRATEIVDRIKSAVLTLFPEKHKGKVIIDSIKTEGHGQIPIIIITAQVKEKQLALAVFEHIIGRLSAEDRRHIDASLERRIDEKCTFFLRFDKQEAYKGNLQLASGPDIISVKVYLREYPRCNRKEIIEFLKIALNHLERE